ncbi:hypothetical protein FB451DRAFT_1208375 [Mycena latifolia]|nr:hypothetical protein FB451DRAFT_1208375 [Mycena latifolia]
MSQTQNLEDTSQMDCSEDECRRVADLWFPDATLILRAENTLFRVYPGILSARSTVFGDMISVPQPAEPEGRTLNGHPIVLLHDSAAEVEAFLRAMFDSNYFMPPPSPVDFAAIIGIMRLGHKYDVPYLFRRALNHLECVFPTTPPNSIHARTVTPCRVLSLLETGLDFTDFIRTTSTTKHITLPSEPVTMNLITIRVASEVGAVWLLPAAYYSACTFSAQDLLSAGHSWDALSPDKQQICLISQVELVRASSRSYRFLFHVPSPNCPSKAKCQMVVSGVHNLLQRRIDLKLDIHPLLPEIFNNRSVELCDGCRKLATEMFDEAQKSFWQEFPGILGLPSWEELKNRRTEALEVEGGAINTRVGVVVNEI